MGKNDGNHIITPKAVTIIYSMTVVEIFFIDDLRQKK